MLAPFVLFVLAAPLLARSFGPLPRTADMSAAQLLAVTLLVDVPLVAVTLLLARRLLGASSAALGLRRPRLADLRYGLLFGSGLFLAAVAVGLVHSAIVGTREPQAVIRALLASRGPLDLALFFVAASIVAPIAEELLFRGVLFSGLRQRTGFIAAALLSAAAFMAVHETSAWPQVFLLGFALALAYERTRTLWSSIATHAVVNALPLLLLALTGMP